MQNFAQQKKSFDLVNTSVRTGRQLEIPLQQAQAPPTEKKKRELTTFNIVMLLIFSAAVVVGYIGNVIAVDRLLVDIRRLEKQEAELKLEGERIRASINMLASYTRIQKIAMMQLGLVHSGQQPSSLNVYGLSETNEK